MMCADNSIVTKPKTNKKCGSHSEHLSNFKALSVEDLERKVGMMHASNLEHIPIFKVLCGDDPEQNTGTIHASNLKHLPVLKALRRDDPCVQSRTPPRF